VSDGPVLAVFAHPDDAEITAGGTIAKWCAAGRTVHLLVLTNGDRGSNDASVEPAELARTRERETVAAAEVLGVEETTVLGVPDGELENTAEVRGHVVSAIRGLRPSTLVSCDPTAWFLDDRYVNHADHRTAGEIALDSIFPGAGNPHFFPEHLARGLSAHQVTDVWLGLTSEPNHHEDVTGHLETKLAALAEHESQVEGGMLGYLEEWIPKEAEEAGRAIGVRHAESFRRLDLSQDS
jgi:LmbE family N-acetylglucosaminyl deacetylase